MTKQSIELSVNDLMLRGKFYLPDKSKDLAILFLHGWTGVTNEGAAELLADNGYPTMTFSLSGHNDSDGKIEDQTRQKSLQEVLAAYDLFRSRLPNDAKIGVAGNSYGGYMAAILSATRPISVIQMRVPADYPDEGFDEPQMGKGGEDPDVMRWRRQPLGPEETRALRAVHDFSGPIQILEAELDDHVPHQIIQNYIDAISDRTKLDYHFMKGWPHSLGDDPERNWQYQSLLLNWLNNISEQL